jgi:hypothetical protein
MACMARTMHQQQLAARKIDPSLGSGGRSSYQRCGGRGSLLRVSLFLLVLLLGGAGRRHAMASVHGGVARVSRRLRLWGHAMTPRLGLLYGGCIAFSSVGRPGPPGLASTRISYGLQDRMRHARAKFS